MTLLKMNLKSWDTSRKIKDFYLSKNNMAHTLLSIIFVNFIHELA